MEERENINFKKISQDTGVVKGKIFYSETFKSWVVSGHEDIDMICIDPPKQIGDFINGNRIKNIKIEGNQWVYSINL